MPSLQALARRVALSAAVAVPSGAAGFALPPASEAIGLVRYSTPADGAAARSECAVGVAALGGLFCFEVAGRRRNPPGEPGEGRVGEG